MIEIKFKDNAEGHVRVQRHTSGGMSYQGGNNALCNLKDDVTIQVVAHDPKGIACGACKLRLELAQKGA